MVSVAEQSPLRDKVTACGWRADWLLGYTGQGFPLRQPTIDISLKSRRGLGVCNNPLTHLSIKEVVHEYR
jgi:hypothetical protein